MTRRSWIIFLQAGVVGVLLVVVYLTILQPNDDRSVSGVTAPGAQGPVATKPPDRAQHRRRRASQTRQRGAARVVTGPGAPGAGPTVPAPVAAATPTSVPVGPTPSTGGPGESPSDDQYSGTLARLNSALR